MTGAVVLVAGSGGVIGSSAVRHFSSRGFLTRGVSRRTPASSEGWEHLAADLLDAEEARESLARAADTTRLVFAAYIEEADPVRQIEVNMALLRNTLDALQSSGAPLEHVTLYQGMKFYGAHLGDFRTPAKEDDPRLVAPNFYYEQEALLRERADRDGFALTIFRPEGVMGHAQGTPMNLLMVIAAYVAITRKLGVPLRFPGPRHVYDHILYQMSDADLLARATEWAASEPAAHGEAFNLTNGDVIRWRHLFQAVAEHYGLALEEPQQMVLDEQMPFYSSLWDEIVAEHGLVATSWSDLVDWRFGDAIFGSDFDNVSSTIKVRRAGFAECHDTIERTLELLDDLGHRRIVPPA
ncbi:NAD-dependent dehydratase [Arthrobacter sp. RIT-PI-e]|uniref:SDR family oxidoreductase n=1 Tax=Arthrobacter sp. RIT-PI-e TaxID=1681197 RepID=UPI000676570D|nr:SDR family oxidoreductase [Arthrobacter sp. RIT-PI-e]KNC18523.1 NAD-dependent dehydratase [Arthrobacter sp. RIT-PI-e]